MKLCSAALTTLFTSGLQIPFFECFTLTLSNGMILRVTDCDRPVILNTVFFRSDHIQIRGLKYKATTGLEVDSQEMTVIAWPKDTINGIPFLQAVCGKVLDGATVKRERAYFDPASWPPAPGQPAIALDSDVRFLGFVADVKSVTRMTASIDVKSYLLKLDHDFPRNFYQPTCGRTLFDTGCTLLKANYSKQGVVGSSPTATFIPFALGGSGGTAHAVLSSSAGSGIGQVILTSDSASNATYLAEPTVTITDPTGSSAVLKAIGVISSPQEGGATGSRFYLYGVTVVSAGSGYTNPTVTITPASGDPGTGATAQAVLASGVATVTSIVIDTAGSGYSPKAQFVLTGGGGTGAIFYPTVNSSGGLTGATLLSGGTGYSSAPTVQVVDSGSIAYGLGTIYFESGASTGQYRQIKAASGGGFYLANPLDTTPTAGDNFAYWPGCDKTQGPGGCGGFSNTANFKGYPFIPPAQTAY